MGEQPIVIEIPPVDTWTLKDLKYACRRNKVKGYTTMNRDQLVSAVKDIIKNKK